MGVLSVTRLYAMYDEPEPLPLPDTDSSQAIEALAAAGIYIHLKNKAGVYKVPYPPP